MNIYHLEINISLLTVMFDHSSDYIGWTECIVEVLGFEKCELEDEGHVLTSGESPLSQEILSR